MTTHAELAAKLLRDASKFFRNVGEQNEHLKDELTENAAIYEQAATMVENDPHGELPDPEPQDGGAAGTDNQAG